MLGKNTGLEDFFVWLRNDLDPTVSWSDLDFIRESRNGSLTVKGIPDVEDARASAELGADRIVVSDHGGRRLDGVPSTARAPPPIAETVGHRLTVLADGGVRSRLDVVQMLALGAQGVSLGGARVYALGGGARPKCASRWR